MQQFARALRGAGSKVAAAAGATASVSASTSAAQAYHVRQIEPRRGGAVDLKDRLVEDDYVLFSAVDSATEDVENYMTGLWTPRSTDADVDSDTSSSSGGLADSIIELAGLPAVLPPEPSPDSLQQDARVICSLANRLLKRPGLQMEIVKAMVEDPFSRSVLLERFPELEQYLSDQHIAAFGLLEAPAGVEDSESVRGEGGLHREPKWRAFVGKLAEECGKVLGKAVERIELAGCAATILVERLMNWVKGNLKGTKFEAVPDVGQNQDKGPQRKGHGPAAFFGTVTVVAVAILCVVIIKNPRVFAKFLATAAKGVKSAA